MFYRVCMALSFLICVSAVADDKKDKDAKAALALEIAKEKELHHDKEAHKSLSVGQSMGKSMGKPVVIRYGDFPCLGTCAKLHEFVLVNLPKDAEGDRLRVSVWNPKDESWYYDEFKTVPTVVEVRTKLADLRKKLGIVAVAKKDLDWDF